MKGRGLIEEAFIVNIVSALASFKLSVENSLSRMLFLCLFILSVVYLHSVDFRFSIEVYLSVTLFVLCQCLCPSDTPSLSVFASIRHTFSSICFVSESFSPSFRIPLPPSCFVSDNYVSTTKISKTKQIYDTRTCFDLVALS
eukprot:m.48336 g.48336  ORF g.48336 m.48336 type:complete len:142 (+) comp20712_c0_seq1:392-817(+)